MLKVSMIYAESLNMDLILLLSHLLEETYGTSWRKKYRKKNAEKKIFNKRLKVIQIVKESISLENAVEILEKPWIENGWNIDWMGELKDTDCHFYFVKVGTLLLIFGSK
jgi:hypothetical protein